MLPKQRRLTSRDFNLVVRQGYTLAGKVFSIKIAKTKGLGGFGVAVSSKVKTAVERNRIRRLVYGALSKIKNVLKKTDVVVFVRSTDPMLVKEGLGEIALLAEKVPSHEKLGRG